jgi:hypothetical protein
MKEQISNLVGSFAALSAITEHVMQASVRDLIQQSDSTRNLRVGDVSLMDVSRRELYTTLLVTQAYFSVFSTTTKMFTRVSRDHVMPGLNLVDPLSRGDVDQSEFTARKRMLNDFMNHATVEVKELIAKVCTVQVTDRSNKPDAFSSMYRARVRLLRILMLAPDSFPRSWRSCRSYRRLQPAPSARARTSSPLPSLRACTATSQGSLPWSRIMARCSMTGEGDYEGERCMI